MNNRRARTPLTLEAIVTGPSDFSRRAARLFPNDSERIREISKTYIALRYASEPAAIILDRFAKEVRAFAGHGVDARLFLDSVAPAFSHRKGQVRRIPNRTGSAYESDIGRWLPDKIFFRNWILCTFLLPIDVYDPPASAIVKQLDAVNSARERLRIVRVMTRFIDAPDVSDVSELFSASGNFLFERSVLGNIRFHAGDESIYVQHLRCKTVTCARLYGRD